MQQTGLVLLDLGELLDDRVGNEVGASRLGGQGELLLGPGMRLSARDCREGKRHCRCSAIAQRRPCNMRVCVPRHDVGSDTAIRRVAHDRRSGGRRRGEKVVPRRPGDCYEEAREKRKEEATEDEKGCARANGAVLAMLWRGHRGRIVWEASGGGAVDVSARASGVRVGIGRDGRVRASRRSKTDVWC